MILTRRVLLAVFASSLTAGCVSDGGGNSTPVGSTTEPSGNDCDPADVTRPPIIEDSNHSPQGYGTKPQELTEQSVADYLADFETAFAWNRILDEYAPVTSLGVNTTTAWIPEAAGEGFLASSRIEAGYAKEGDDDRTVRTYTASYYVSEGPVYRAETSSEAVDPRTHSERQLVQCGTDTAEPTPGSPTEEPTPGGEVTNAIEYIIRNDDDQPHQLELTIETPQGDVVHQRADSEFLPDEQLRGSFTPTEVSEEEFPVTISLPSISTTIGWKPAECALFDLLVVISADGQLDIEREMCIK